MNIINKNLLLSVIASVFLLVGCGGSGGSPTGTSDSTRDVTGVLGSGSGSSTLQSIHAEGCGADLVIATDSEGNTTTAEVCSGNAGDDAFPECTDAEACSFTISLTEETSYVIAFVLDGDFVATLTFNSGITGFSTGVIPLSDCALTSDPLDLGVITFTGSLAIPTTEPLEQTDDDCDGIPDLDDDDDDGDGIPDDEEEDCDLDGFSDDEDEDDDECEDDDDGAGLARVFEVKPRNDPQPERGNDRIDVDKEVRARTGCVLDQTSVTSDTFRVESDTDTIACTYEFSGKATGTRMECEHDDQPFQVNTVYTATIDGVLCLDGREIAAVSWSWLTETEDDDDGDDEDDRDDCDDVCEDTCEEECEGDDDDCEDECEDSCEEECINDDDDECVDDCVDACEDECDDNDECEEECEGSCEAECSE